MTFYRPISRLYFAFYALCALTPLAHASESSEPLEPFVVHCEALANPSGVSLDGPWFFKSQLSQTNANAPDLTAGESVILKTPLSFEKLGEELNLPNAPL